MRNSLANSFIKKQSDIRDSANVEDAKEKIEEMLKMHKKATSNTRQWKASDVEWLKRYGTQSEPDISLSMIQPDERDFDDVEAYLSTIVDSTNIPKIQDFETRAEENFENFISQTTDIIPLLKGFPKKQRDLAWRAQLKLSKKTLDDRIWNQKVFLQKSKRALKGSVPMDELVEEIKAATREVSLDL